MKMNSFALRRHLGRKWSPRDTQHRSRRAATEWHNPASRAANAFDPWIGCGGVQPRADPRGVQKIHEASIASAFPQRNKIETVGTG